MSLTKESSNRLIWADYTEVAKETETASTEPLAPLGSHLCRKGSMGRDLFDVGISWGRYKTPAPIENSPRLTQGTGKVLLWPEEFNVVSKEHKARNVTPGPTGPSRFEERRSP